MFEYHLCCQGSGLGGELGAVVEMRLGIKGAFLGKDPAAGGPEAGLEPFHEVVGSPLHDGTVPRGGCPSDEKTERHERAAERAAHAAGFPDAFRKRGSQGQSLVFFQASTQPLIERRQHGLRTVQLPAEKEVPRALADQRGHPDGVLWLGVHSMGVST